MLPRRPLRRGQIFVEYVLSLIGIIMFAYVALNVWIWLGRMIVERQQSFQETRVIAGQAGNYGHHPPPPDTAGMAVPYQRPPLEIMSDVGSTSPPRGNPWIDHPFDFVGCYDTPAYRAARDLSAQAEALTDQYNTDMAQMEVNGQQLEVMYTDITDLKSAEMVLQSDVNNLQTQIDDLDTQIADPATDPADIPQLTADRDALAQQQTGVQTQLTQNQQQQAVLQQQIDTLQQQQDLLQAQTDSTLAQIQPMWQQISSLLESAFSGCN